MTRRSDDDERSAPPSRPLAALVLRPALGRRRDAARLAPVSRRQGRRARRDGADHRARREGGRTSTSRSRSIPGAALFKPNEQWNALVNGQLDISLVPARLRERQGARVRRDADARAWCAATSAPQRMNDSPFMKDIKAQDRQGRRDRARRRLARRRHRLEERLHPQARRHQGPEGPLRRPDLRRDVAGGRRVDRLDPVATRSTTRCRPASPRRTDTSTGSFVSFRIYEQVKCVTAPGDNALWFMYEPVLMSKKSFDRLDKKQQDALLHGRQEGAGVLRQGSEGPRRRDGQGVQGPQRRGGHAHAGRVRRLARRSRRRARTPSSPRKCPTARS